MVAVFMVMGVLSLVAAFDVLPFSKKWNSDLKMLEDRKKQAASAEAPTATAPAAEVAPSVS